MQKTRMEQGQKEVTRGKTGKQKERRTERERENTHACTHSLMLSFSQIHCKCQKTCIKNRKCTPKGLRN